MNLFYNWINRSSDDVDSYHTSEDEESARYTRPPYEERILKWIYWARENQEEKD